MVDKVIRHIIRAVIESFPIDEKRKADILQNMQKKTSEEGKNDVL